MVRNKIFAGDEGGDESEGQGTGGRLRGWQLLMGISLRNRLMPGGE